MKRIIAGALCLSMLLLSGCKSAGTVYSNYRELEEMELILSMGFDVVRDGVRLSVAGTSGSDEGGDGPAPKQFTRLAAAERSITGAMETIQDFATKEELFYAHTQYVLVGEGFAKTGLPMLLDYLQGTTGVRTSTPLFVVRGDTAERLVTGTGGQSSDITTVLNSTILDSRRRGDGHPFSCGDLIAAVNEHGAGLVMALKVVPTDGVEPGVPEEAVTPLPDGYAIVKDDTVVDYIPQSDARGVNLLIGQPGQGSITVEVPEAGIVTVKMTRCTVKTDTVWGGDGSVSGLTGKIRGEVYLLEAEHPRALDDDAVLEAVAGELERWVTGVLEKMRDTKADFLGIGLQQRMRHPVKWDKAPRSWEEVLGELTFDVQAECVIARSGELKR